MNGPQRTASLAKGYIDNKFARCLIVTDSGSEVSYPSKDTGIVEAATGSAASAFLYRHYSKLWMPPKDAVAT